MTGTESLVVVFKNRRNSIICNVKTHANQEKTEQN